MESILDFNEKLDIQLLDNIIKTLYEGRGTDQQNAQKIITQFQEHPDAWQRVDYILEYSNNLQTKYIGLQILEKLIQTKWNILPREQCDGIKNYIVSIIIKKASTEEILRTERIFINKLNIVLVQILKQEWPKKWPTFITEILGASRTNMSLCENNMHILKLLSEEIFDYSTEQMTTVKAKNLKHQLNTEFSEIFQLCSEILEKAQKPSLLIVTLEALLRFLRWIPLGYIFETHLVENLKSKFLPNPHYRNVTLACLTEIASLIIEPQYDSKFVQVYHNVMDIISKTIPYSSSIDFSRQYSNASDADQKFLQNLALFFASIFGAHLTILENHADREALVLGHMYLLKISMIDDREIFKICLEYWNKLVLGLYNELPPIQPFPNTPPIMLGSIIQTNSRRSIYLDILSELRLVMIAKMVKPEEVLIVEDENGEIVREFVKETDTITLYKSMRECLVLLTHLDYEDTETIMTEKLARQFDGSEWSWGNLNKLCWAIGSISYAMNEEVEKRFLVTVIRDLLGLCEMKRGKDNKAVIASNIMYIVGQYPRFLRAHWKFLKTVVNKLFEFMHELHEGVQDMACDTFIKISKKCHKHFVMLQPGESQPFLEEILLNIGSIICDLQPQQIHTFYEAIGYMIPAQTDSQERSRLIGIWMDLPNQMFDSILASIRQNADNIHSPENIKHLDNILKTNLSACRSCGAAFLSQISRIFLDVLTLYRTVSAIISETVSSKGIIAAKTPIIRGMRAIKKDTLKLMEVYVNQAEDLKLVTESFAPSLLEAILGDYNRNIPSTREAEVLNLTAAMIDKLGSLMYPMIIPILDAVFESSLSMISKDFAEYPEHRVGFFRLLQAVNARCFPVLLQLPQQQFKLAVDSIVWAFKHTVRDIGDTGLNICLELLNNMAQTDANISNGFYQMYLLNLLRDIFFVLTDTDHKSGFKMQSFILAHIFYIVDSGRVSVPLYDPAQVGTNTNMNNSVFLRGYVMNLLHSAFPHLQRTQVEIFVKGLFDLNRDIETFKAHLRDFLVQLKEFAGDNTDLFREEMELEQERKKKAEIEAAMMIPGLVKPSERTDDLDD